MKGPLVALGAVLLVCACRKEPLPSEEAPALPLSSPPTPPAFAIGQPAPVAVAVASAAPSASASSRATTRGDVSEVVGPLLLNQQYADARAILEPRIRSGRATDMEIRQYKMACKGLNDPTCKP